MTGSQGRMRGEQYYEPVAPKFETVRTAHFGEEVFLLVSEDGSTLDFTVDVGDQRTTVSFDRERLRSLRAALQRYEKRMRVKEAAHA